MGLTDVYFFLVVDRKRALHKNDQGIVLVPEALREGVWKKINDAVTEGTMKPPEWPCFLGE